MTQFVKIVESVCSGPLRFLPAKGPKLNPGDIVELTEENGNPCCKLSDGKRPFAIVTEVDGPFGLVSIWYETMIVQTDNYESSCRYKVGSNLYVSQDGKLTTVAPYEDAYSLGFVITPPEADNSILEMNWI